MKNKNMQQLLGHSLLAWSIMAARAADGIDRIFVTTDSDEYMQEARNYGAEAPFRRPVELASDVATDLDVFQHFFEWARRETPPLPPAMVHLRPTTPMRDPTVISDAIKVALSRGNEASALRSVHQCPESPYKWFRQDEAGYLVTLDGGRDLDSANAARQSFPSVYVPNGYVDVVYPELVQKSGQLHGRSVLPYETVSTIEVDTEADLELLRRIAKVPPRLFDETLRSSKVGT